MPSLNVESCMNTPNGVCACRAPAPSGSAPAGARLASEALAYLGAGSRLASARALPGPDRADGDALMVRGFRNPIAIQSD